MLVANLLDLYCIIAKNPFNASIEFSKQAIFRADESGADALTRLGMAILKPIIEQQIVPAKPSVFGFNRGSTQARNIKLRYRKAILTWQKFHPIE